MFLYCRKDIEFILQQADLQTILLESTRLLIAIIVSVSKSDKIRTSKLYDFTLFLRYRSLPIFEHGMFRPLWLSDIICLKFVIKC